MTDFDLQQQLVEARRRQYAQQQYQAPQGQMVGRHYIAPNALQYAAAALRGIGGQMGEQQASQELKDLSQKRQELQSSETQALIKALNGTPENAPPTGEAGPVRPAQPGGFEAFYGRAMASPIKDFQTMGMQGQVSMAQEQAKKQQQQAEQQRIMAILQGAKTPQEALAAGVPEATVKAYMESGSWGKVKAGKPIEVTGPNGEKMIQMMNEYGEPMGAPTPAYTAPVQINQGDKITFAVPKPGQSFGVGMSPSERDSSARGWATVRQGDQRLEIDRTKAAGEKAKDEKALTEGQAKAGLYLSQMRSASAELDKLPQVSPATIAATNSPYTNWAAGATSQKAAQAQRQWAEAYLRAKTGAAATTDEVEGNIRTFFPVVGDSKDVIEQKTRMRKKAEFDMEIPAGPAVPKINAIIARQQSPDGFRVIP